MAKYTWGSTVIIKQEAAPNLRAGAKVDIVGISEEKDRKGEYLEKYPHGTVYTIEYIDGSDAQAHEDDLALLQ
jgi:hypothetical protein